MIGVLVYFYTAATEYEYRFVFRAACSELDALKNATSCVQCAASHIIMLLLIHTCIANVPTPPDPPRIKIL